MLFFFWGGVGSNLVIISKERNDKIRLKVQWAILETIYRIYAKTFVHRFSEVVRYLVNPKSGA